MHNGSASVWFVDSVFSENVHEMNFKFASEVMHTYVSLIWSYC